jgi:hypothetical protein
MLSQKTAAARLLCRATVYHQPYAATDYCLCDCLLSLLQVTLILLPYCSELIVQIRVKAFEGNSPILQPTSKFKNRAAVQSHFTRFYIQLSYFKCCRVTDSNVVVSKLWGAPPSRGGSLRKLCSKIELIIILIMSV